MHNLIIFSSRYGYTRECALKLSSLLDQPTAVIDADRQEIPSPDSFSTVIIGSSIYMGQISSRITDFFTHSREKLAGKKIGLFLCCGRKTEFAANLGRVFPDWLVRSAVVTSNFGGELRSEKMSFLHRLITFFIKRAGSNPGDLLPIPEEIEKFAGKLKQ